MFQEKSMIYIMSCKRSSSKSL